MTNILDTNALVRFLVRDNEKQYKQVVNWFKEAENRKRKIMIKPLVIAETCFVLESFYKQKIEDIAQKMEVFLSQKWLKVEEREVMIGLWQWYRKKLHFVDSYLISWSKVNKGRVLGFDKALLKNIK